jgi:hypothetical protein
MWYPVTAGVQHCCLLHVQAIQEDHFMSQPLRSSCDMKWSSCPGHALPNALHTSSSSFDRFKP